MRALVVSLAWGLVVGAAVLGLRLTRAFFFLRTPLLYLRLHSSDSVMSPTYFLASVMLVMFWDILLNEFHDLLDDDKSLTLSPLSLLRQLILFIAGKSGRGRGGGRGGALPGSNVVDIDALPLHHPDLGLGAMVEMMDICTKKLKLLLIGRMAMIMTMALRNPNLMRALPKETKLIRRNGPRSPRNAARIANASIPPLTRLPLLPLIPLLPLHLTLIQTLTLPINARTRARRSSN